MAAVAEAEATLVAANALEEQEAGAVAVVKANVQGSGGRPEPIPAGGSSTVCCSARKQDKFV